MNLLKHSFIKLKKQ